MSGNGAYQDEMNEVALFMDALPAAVPTEPDPSLEATLVPRLAATARASTLEAETRTMRRVTRPGARAARRRPRSRLALVARVGIAVGLIPLVLAGLAVAGVTVPGPARDAFDSVGIALPNQPDENSQKATEPSSQAGGNDVSDAAKTKAKGQGGNSAAAHQHALAQRVKAKGRAIGLTRGKAIGLNDLMPPKSAQTGAPAHSNAGGSTQSQSARTAPKSRPTHVPSGSAKGRSKR